MLFDEKDQGRTVLVPVGSSVIVRLNENPTTGYRWTIADPGGLEFVGETFEPGAAAMGASGVRVFTFRAKQSGSSRLRLKNWRVWESEMSVLNRFEITLDVR